MAISTSVISVGTTPTLLSQGGGALNDPRPVLSYVGGTDQIVYMGGPEVTIADGIPVTSGAQQSHSLMMGDDLYGVVESSTCPVRVMVGRVSA